MVNDARPGICKSDRMDETSFTLPAADGTELSAYRWSGDGDPKAIVAISHGMGEHVGRYRRLAEALTAAGYVVYGYDQRGHGGTAGSADGQGDLGAGGWRGLVGDIGTVTAHARQEHAGVPVVALGHSMGSFALQQYLLDHSADLDGAVLSGTTALDVIAPGIDPNAEIDLSAFNAPFEPARTEYEWLSRDPDEVDKYVADDGCGFGLNPAGAASMLADVDALADEDRLAAIRSDLPIYLLSGDADPLAGGGPLVQLVADRYTKAGVGDVTVDLYPAGRHEMFNETNRDEVTANLIAWLERVTAR